MQAGRDRDTERERQQHDERPHQTRCTQMPLCATGQTQFGTYDEHEQDEPDLAESIKGGQAGRRKQEGLSLWRDRAEYHRSERDSRKHFADHWRLAEMTQQDRQDARRAKDRDQLDQQDRDGVHVDCPPPATGSNTSGGVECERR